jgi:CheY-like chemotaxis protein/anti-sigma regulatory factor (Ser/Thr protein kinase)
MRLTGKPILFFTNIDSNIPNSLIGDEARLRQILLNILSNAVKYSERGHIGLSMTLQKKEDHEARVWLKIAVSDTGKGIKPEDQAILFDEFTQVDTKKNQGIEGTGLGLAITKRLCTLMGGDITVSSEYGSGSTFTVIVPQKIESDAPFATVSEPERKRVLVYDTRAVYSQSICWSLENMCVPFTQVANMEDFTKALNQEEWFFIFTGYGLYEKVKPLLEQTSGKSPHLALMIDWGIEPYVPNVRYLAMPVHSLSIADLLNEKIADKGCTEDSVVSSVSQFSIPGARLLLVDDILTNLKVAEGLLEPYKATVDICLSGKDAIELVKQRDYDLIFMDHMMPDMDGIEATAHIRAWEKEQEKISMSFTEGETQRYCEPSVRRKQVPIVALTANAVVGMREMFIEKDFDDFLAKPIDVSKLEEILGRWIKIGSGGEEGTGDRGLGTRGLNSESSDASGLYPDNSNNDPQSPVPPEKSTRIDERVDEQMPHGVGQTKAAVTGNSEGPPSPQSLLPTLPGVDIERGLKTIGGNMQVYQQILGLFCEDAEERLPVLQS